MQWQEVQVNIELTLNVPEKIEKATRENLEGSLGWSDFPKHHAVIRPSGKSSWAASARLYPALHNTHGELLSILRVNLQYSRTIKTTLLFRVFCPLYTYKSLHVLLYFIYFFVSFSMDQPD